MVKYYKHSVQELRQFLKTNLQQMKYTSWLYVYSRYYMDIETIREYREYLDWSLIIDCGVINELDQPINCLREFRKELNWQEEDIRKWFDELSRKSKYLHKDI